MKSLVTQGKEKLSTIPDMTGLVTQGKERLSTIPDMNQTLDIILSLKPVNSKWKHWVHFVHITLSCK